jgi:hypothetical protein
VKKRPLKLWIKVAVTAVLLGLISVVVPWGELWSQARQLDPAIWLAVFGCFLLGHLGGVVKWRFNVNIARGGLGLVDAVQIYFAGLFANLCLPSIVGGDGLKVVLAGRITGRYVSAIIGGLTDRLIDTAALLILIVTVAAPRRGQWSDAGRARPGIDFKLAVAVLIARSSVRADHLPVYRIRHECGLLAATHDEHHTKTRNDPTHDGSYVEQCPCHRGPSAGGHEPPESRAATR